MNDSSTGGYLSPIQSTPPTEDSALEDFLHTMIAGITGLDAQFVWPLPTTSEPPAPSVNWCGFTVISFEADSNTALQQLSADDTGLRCIRQEAIEVRCQFYGPNAGQNACVLRDGLYVSQNGEQLQIHDFGLIDTSGITAAPDVVNQQVRRRYDVSVRLCRKVTRSYRVMSLVSAQTSVATE